MCLHFSSGVKIVYKPKSLQIDVHFQALLAWLNDRGASPPLRPLSVINCGDYGWMAYIEHESCQSEAELQRYYTRLGSYLALLYLLEGRDFHAYNIIASGEHPMLPDLEGLFHPRWAHAFKEPPSQQLGFDQLLQSVMRIGMLPYRGTGAEMPVGFDMSGLSGGQRQLSPHPTAYWEDVGMDTMRVSYKRQLLVGGVGQNSPIYKGESALAINYVDEIVHGFEQMYRLCFEHRAALLNGILAQFAGDEVRVILRGTEIYKRFMLDSCHPLFINQTALTRDRFFSRLLIGLSYQPLMVRVLWGEQRDMEQGDTPVFTARTDSPHLWMGENEQRAHFFEMSSLERVKDRVKALSEADLTRQVWFIRASFAAAFMGELEANTFYETIPTSSRPTTADLAAMAKAVSQRLEALMLRDGESVSWIGIVPLAARYGMLNPVGLDLYSGLPGILLFGAYLGAVTGEERGHTLAHLVWQTLQRDLAASPSMGQLGGFDGWGSLIYTLTHLGVLWREQPLLDRAKAIAMDMMPRIDQDQQLDVMSGSAGLLLSVLALHQAAPHPDLLAVAVRCGEHLLAQAQTMPAGLGWANALIGDRPLTGFSHGAAGIAYALLLLGVRTENGRFCQAAQQALAYERSLYNPEQHNWPDLRDEADDPAYKVAWCHGATGIGLARLGMRPYLPHDMELDDEIQAAVHTTRQYGFGRNHSLCHGDLGNIELFLQAQKVLSGTEWQNDIDDQTMKITTSIAQHGWLCGLPMQVETPGLMTGLAGIGYGLLRLAFPTKVPALLLLEAPAPDVVT